MLDVLDSHNVDRGRTDVDEVYQALDTKVLTMDLSMIYYIQMTWYSN